MPKAIDKWQKLNRIGIMGIWPGNNRNSKITNRNKYKRKSYRTRITIYLIRMKSMLCWKLIKKYAKKIDM